MSDECRVCGIKANGPKDHVWMSADPSNYIPAPPVDLVFAQVCDVCYVAFGSLLEPLIRARDANVVAWAATGTPNSKQFAARDTVTTESHRPCAPSQFETIQRCSCGFETQYPIACSEKYVCPTCRMQQKAWSS